MFEGIVKIQKESERFGKKWKDPENICKILKESERLEKHRKDLKRIGKIPKESKGFRKNWKDSESVRKNLKQLERTWKNLWNFLKVSGIQRDLERLSEEIYRKMLRNAKEYWRILHWEETRLERLSVFKAAHKIDKIYYILKESVVPTKNFSFQASLRPTLIPDYFCKISMFNDFRIWSNREREFQHSKS